MQTEQATQNKETKTTEKCTCTKRISELEKKVEQLKTDISVLRRVLLSGK